MQWKLRHRRGAAKGARRLFGEHPHSQLSHHHFVVPGAHFPVMTPNSACFPVKCSIRRQRRIAPYPWPIRHFWGRGTHTGLPPAAEASRFSSRVHPSRTPTRHVLLPSVRVPPCTPPRPARDSLPCISVPPPRPPGCDRSAGRDGGSSVRDARCPLHHPTLAVHGQRMQS